MSIAPARDAEASGAVEDVVGESQKEMVGADEEEETTSDADVTHMPVGRRARKRNEKDEEIKDKYYGVQVSDAFQSGTTVTSTGHQSQSCPDQETLQTPARTQN